MTVSRPLRTIARAALLLVPALGALAEMPQPLRPPLRGVGAQAGGEVAAPRLIPNYEKPDPMPPGSFPPVDLKSSNTAVYVGFQFGPTKRDVLYCCFDQDDPTENPERCWWFIPGTNAPGARLLRSKALQVRPVRGRGIAPAEPRIFEFPPVRAQFGQVAVMQKLTLTYGYQTKGLLHVSAETKLSDQGGESQCRLDALLGEQSRMLPSQNIIPLLGPAAMKVYVDTKQADPAVRPWINVGKDFILQPLRGMDGAVEILVRQPPELAPVPEPGKRPKPVRPGGDDVVKKTKAQVKLRERSQPGGHGEGDGELLPLSSLKAGQKYLIETRINLGHFGTIGATNALAVPDKVKL